MPLVTEPKRHLHDGPCSELGPWNDSRVLEIPGAGRGFFVKTERQFDDALHEAERHARSFCLSEVELAQLDRSPALERLVKNRAEHW